MEIPQVLSEFAYRLAFGLSLAMACTSPRLVTSGYFRVHSYVVLGLSALAAAVAFTEPEQVPLWPALVTALASYAASVAWLYEKPRAGRTLLALVALVALAGAWLALPATARRPNSVALLWFLDAVASGLLLGSAMAAMLLGHWYLNTPSMQLAPLRRLVLLLGAAVAVRAIVSAAGLSLELGTYGPLAPDQVAFLALRLLAGILGTGIVAVMTWRVLRIPNTQSATGLLYVAVITTFLGELTARLLSGEMGYPV